MKHSPLVSIITPSYNQGKFIEETIRSVLSQDYPNIEYIVVDGGSTDNTLEILKKYEGRLRWISEKDRGQSDAINKGFGMAKGEILAWLNSDDTYLPGAITKVVDFLDAHPRTRVVYGRSYYTDIEGKAIGEYPVGPFDYRRLAVFNFISQPSVFFRRSAWNAVKWIDESLNYTMDYDLWIRMAKGGGFDYIEDFLSTYRLHVESKTVGFVHAVKVQKETLETVMRHYNWAPVNRVYGYCYHVVKNRLPSSFAKFGFMVVSFALLFSIVKYIGLNRGVRAEDLRLINPGYIKKLFGGWEAKDILRRGSGE
jgi:glycosyltransferase involved in cell wall biosynthesis